MFAARQLFNGDLNSLTLAECRQAISDNYDISEQPYIEQLLPLIQLPADQQQQCLQRTRQWVRYIREHQHQHWGVEPLLREFSLDSEEGLALMTLAEALIRIPDSATANALIADRLQSAQWKPGDRDAQLWLNLSNWALGYAGNCYQQTPERSKQLSRVVKKLGEPLLRSALQRAVAILADRFVMGEDIYQALDRAQDGFQQGNSFSFDMLGEAAVCRQDCQHYLHAYQSAISALGKNESYPKGHTPPSVSIKLSALHSRFSAVKGEAMLEQLYQQAAQLVQSARKYDVAISIDAEESDRLEPTLEIFQRLYEHEAAGWGKLGLAVQAYSKRALPVLHWLNRLAQMQGDPIPLRLVKGAYWDSEIKWAQQLGLSNYPVFTRKAATDISYLACARFLLSEQAPYLIPQFATHNAQTLSQLLGFRPDGDFECQRLHGMGAALYQGVQQQQPIRCRVYAPVGEHKELLPYLVRRLLENGANSSFVNQIADPGISEQHISQPPQQRWQQHGQTPPAKPIPLPGEIFAPRKNSRGININLEHSRRKLLQRLQEYQSYYYQSAPLIAGRTETESNPIPCYSPQDQQRAIGERYDAEAEHATAAIMAVQAALPAWRDTAATQRAEILEKMAEQLEDKGAELIYLLQHEAGKTLQDAIDELREAVDFCRYYAAQARQLFDIRELPGVTGESNTVSLHPRGLFVCISPWNFPLAIFTGQVSAALVTGNGVVAKPAKQTSLIAYRCCQLWFEAGLPADVLALLPGPSQKISRPLLNHPAIDGVAFTGSADSARLINRQLAQREHTALPALIAETGGQNAMIVDSSALLQHVVRDAIHSAFGSAGQRCSALRVLYVQEDIAEQLTELLCGAMDELITGLPQDPATDVGPLIDSAAQGALEQHIAAMRAEQRVLHQSPGAVSGNGYFLPPTLVRLDTLNQLEQEHFGPILHLIRFRAGGMQQLVGDINNSGYGLTLSLHSRNQRLIEQLSTAARVGNIYINRNQTGAVVEAQPFGGRGLSGTGPKAGGPHYLMGFVYEKTLTTNTTAWGGNVDLLAARESDD